MKNKSIMKTVCEWQNLDENQNQSIDLLNRCVCKSKSHDAQKSKRQQVIENRKKEVQSRRNKTKKRER